MFFFYFCMITDYDKFVHPYILDIKYQKTLRGQKKKKKRTLLLIFAVGWFYQIHTIRKIYVCTDIKFYHKREKIPSISNYQTSPCQETFCDFHCCEIIMYVIIMFFACFKNKVIMTLYFILSLLNDFVVALDSNR